MKKLPTLPSSHDLTHLTAAMKHVRRFGLAVDAGAHRGIWSREMLKHFHFVFAVEPNPDHYAELDALVAACHGNFAAWRGALGAMHRYATLKAGPHNDGQWHLDPDKLSGPVTVVPLDDFAESFLKYGVDFLKLDIEGCELLGLMGATHIIARDHPIVMIEENGLCERYGMKWGDAGQWLRDHGYKKVEHLNKDEVYAPRRCEEHVPVTPEEQYTRVKCVRCGARGSVDPHGIIVWEET